MASILDIFKKIDPRGKSDASNLMASTTHGTEIFGGYFFEEYLNEILGNEWARIADRMRRSSDQVTMLLSLVKSPIVSATWDIDFKTETEEEEKIKEFIEFNLFELIDFDQFIEEALTFLEFGHSVFEVVYRPQIKHLVFPNTITLKKISFIDPKTIEEWNVKRDGDLESLRQCADGDLSVDVTVEADKLMTFAINKEGANFEGRSLLRPIYGNWKRKQQFLKIKAMGIERSSMGTPIGVLPKGNNDGQRKNLQSILAAFISHQRSTVVVPNGTEVKNFDLSFDAQAVENSIEKERLGMSQAFLAGFMELGNNSGSGSFALSNNLMNIFFGSIQLYANKIAYRINQDIIKTLVDVNFGERATYPKLRASNITDKIGKDFVEQISMLTDKGYLRPNDTTKEFIRKKLNLPESDLEEEEIIDPNIDPTKPRQPAPVGLASQFSTNNKSITFAVKNKNAAVKLIEEDKKELEELMKTELTVRRDKLLASSKKIMNSNEKGKRNKVMGQKLPNSRDYRNKVFDFLVDTSIKATDQAKREVGFSQIELADKEDLAKLTSQTKERLRAEVDLIIDTQESDLSKNLYFPFNNNFDNTDSTDKVIEDMKVGSDRYIDGPPVSVGAANFVSNAVNNGRNDIYQTPAVFEEIESFTITNPSPTAAICVELAGRTITPEQYINGILPPFHHRCNSIVVANKKGAKGNPNINPLGLSFTGTPAEVEKIIKSQTL